MAEISNLSLWTAKAAVFNYFPDSLPRTIHLDGFRYDRLANSTLGAGFFFSLLGRNRTLAPQPYRQLASVLAAHGHRGEALNVLSRYELKRLGVDAIPWILSPLLWVLWLLFYIPSLAITSLLQAGRIVPAIRRWKMAWYRLSAEISAYSAPPPLFAFLYWPLRFILWITAGHGYHPFRAVYWLTAVWITGAVVFGAAYDRHLMLPSPDKVAEAKADYSETGATPPTYIAFDPWIYSLDVMLPIVDLQQEVYWAPFAAEQRPNPLTPPPKLSATGQAAVDLGAILGAGAIWLGEGIAAAAGVTDTGLDWLGGQTGLTVLQGKTYAADAVAAMGSVLTGIGGWVIPRVWYWFEVLAGWSLISIAIAGFTGLLNSRDDEGA
ncbi:MAG: hypothetical protein HXY22_09590 [Alphaproteobacteria bacterium]|nr:hypothetical protein [Alphaproteobacteria bacterium]